MMGENTRKDEKTNSVKKLVSGEQSSNVCSCQDKHRDRAAVEERSVRKADSILYKVFT